MHLPQLKGGWWVSLTTGGLAVALAIAAPSTVPAGEIEMSRPQMGDAKLRAETLIGRMVTTPQGQPVGQIRNVMAGDDGQMMNVQIVRGNEMTMLRVPREFLAVAADGSVVMDLEGGEVASFFDSDTAGQGRLD